MICSCVVRATSVISPVMQPSCITRMRSLMPSTSGNSELIIKHRLALGGQAVDQQVDFVLCADVDAARRFVKDHDFRVALQPLGQHDLLLVASRQGGGGLVAAGQLDLQLVDIAVKGGGLAPAAEEAPQGEAVHVGQAEVLLDAAAQDQPLRLAVLGQQADPGGDRVPRVADAQGPAVQRDRAAVAAVRAENQPGRLGSAGADQARQRQDFAAAHLERHVANGPAAVQAADHQPRRAQRRRLLGKLRVQRAADHHLDDPLASHLADRPRAHVGPVAEHHDAVRDLEDLVQAVADVDHAQALGLQLANHVEQVFGFAGRQGRRWVRPSP